MLVLICGEMQLRRELGDAFALDEYERRFPELADDIELQYDADSVLPGGPDMLPAEDAPVESPSLPLPGYEILRELGRGASGVVYLARQISTNRRVAVKAIPLSVSDRQRFTRQHQEAAILSRLQHPHIVQIHDVVERDGMLCLIIEYVEGPTLVEFAAGKPQPPIEAARLVQTLAAAIHVVHDAGILHRDLKPSNILLTTAGDPKITDFGLAKLVSGENLLTTDNCLLGTPCYMPPEQATVAGRHAGRQGDVYSLGAILYELLTGHPPFVGVTVLDTLSLIRDRDPVPCRNSQPQTPRDLETICLKCLKKEPRQRYETAAALAADLGRYLEGSAIEARPPSWMERTETWCRRRPAVAVLAVSLALAIVAGFFGILWQWNEAESARQNESAARTIADQKAAETQQGLERLRAAMVLEERGHLFWEFRRWDDALDALDEAIALCPELSSAWEQRGQVYTDLGLWELALKDRRRAFELNEPGPSEQWWSYGALLAQSGDLAAYRRLCAKMAVRFLGHGGRMAADFARTVCLRPGSGVDYQLVAGRLKALDFHDPLYLYAQGLILYRAGEFQRSIASCLESLSVGEYWSPHPLNYPVLALAYDKLGDVNNARNYFERASQARDGWIQNLYLTGEKNWVTHKGASADWQISPFDWLEFNLLYDEARSQFRQKEPPGDPRLAALRARAFTAIGRFDEAEAEYKAAIALAAPNDARLRMELHRCAAYRLVHQNAFGRAADEFAEAARLEPDDIRLWVGQAQAHLAAGNVQAYQRVCAEMLQRHPNLNNAATADRLVWTCANRVDSLPHMEVLLPLADLALAGYPGAARTKGAALVRAGRYEEALRSFDASSRINAPHPANMCFQAIACYHLGQFDRAQQHVQDAANWIAKADRQRLPSVELTTPAWGNFGWDEHLEALRLLAEAKALIKPMVTSSQRSPGNSTAISK
jgi:tetratricopeptide (TPR) repeat protein/predicted Ser/Thr protein kinase